VLSKNEQLLKANQERYLREGESARLRERRGKREEEREEEQVVRVQVCNGVVLT
jgi:hypothetical protein